MTRPVTEADGACATRICATVASMSLMTSPALTRKTRYPARAKCSITARISAGTLRMTRAISFHHQSFRRSKKVSDETAEQRHLTTEHNSELLCADSSPEELFGGRE